MGLARRARERVRFVGSGRWARRVCYLVRERGFESVASGGFGRVERSVCRADQLPAFAHVLAKRCSRLRFSHPQITSSSSATFLAGRAGSFKVIATGVPTASLSEIGRLPAGVTFTDNGDGTDTFAGTPALDAAGSYQLQLTAVSSVSPAATQNFDLIVPARPALIVAPAITGTAKAGHVLTCGKGSWTGGPTSFAYRWSRNGTPIAGATSSSYKVQAIDEGTTLVCAVAASNRADTGKPATSPGVSIPVPHVKGCPPATGSLSGTTLGLVKLGMTSSQARHVYAHSSTRGFQYKDFFCLTPRGVRVGYASPKLLKTLSKAAARRLNGRVIWASTSSEHYSIEGIRPGATVPAAAQKLHIEKPFHIGLNYWYLASGPKSTYVLKVRDGLVEEIGIGVKALTHGRGPQRTFLTSFD